MRMHGVCQLTLAVTRHMTGLRRVYAFYSCLGCLESNDRERSNFPDNTYVMSRLQLWRCLKDIRLHHEEDFTLVDMDCLLGNNFCFDFRYESYTLVSYLFRAFLLANFETFSGSSGRFRRPGYSFTG